MMDIVGIDEKIHSLKWVLDTYNERQNNYNRAFRDDT